MTKLLINYCSTLIQLTFLEKRKPAGSIVYKALVINWLNQACAPALAFMLADRNEARNPQRIIHANVVVHYKKNSL